MKTFMLDSNIFDKIINNEKLKIRMLELKNTKQIKILTTHIQIDELGATSDIAKRGKLLECANEICECIPTMGVVLGVSRIGMARLSDGEEIEKIRERNLKRTRDALISSTASSDADFLVTEEHSFASRVRRNLTNVQVLNFNEFVKKLNDI
jgi:hypothetical protein